MMTLIFDYDCHRGHRDHRGYSAHRDYRGYSAHRDHRGYSAHRDHKGYSAHRGHRGHRDRINSVPLYGPPRSSRGQNVSVPLYDPPVIPANAGIQWKNYPYKQGQLFDWIPAPALQHARACFASMTGLSNMGME